MTKKLLVIVITAFFNAVYISEIDLWSANDEDTYIYGKIMTEDNETYEGQIRWGKEEAFWFDHFNSTKPENPYLEYLTKDDTKKLNKASETIASKSKGLFNWSKNNNWNSNFTHAFSCEFGNIKSIEMGRKGKVELTLKNDERIKLDGGSNDIQTYVQITDREIGHIKLDWDRIEKVDFMKSPSSFESHYGRPLYGTVHTEEGEQFVGYVQWDHDERLAHDELNGENEDGEIDIQFGNISKIKKYARGSEITLQSGRTLKLRGTNDVNDDNRGIIVNVIGMGRVDIPWGEFDMVSFEEPKTGVLSYSDFDAQEKIRGTVTTNSGTSHKGQIVYDLDETYQLEILNGERDDIEYFIPFHVIEKLEVVNKKKTKVTIKSGKSIILENSVDVNYDNDGILVFTDNNSEPTYIPWEDIAEINL